MQGSVIIGSNSFKRCDLFFTHIKWKYLYYKYIYSYTSIFLLFGLKSGISIKKEKEKIAVLTAKFHVKMHHVLKWNMNQLGILHIPSHKSVPM